MSEHKAESAQIAEAIRRHRMTPYDDGTGDHLFRQAMPEELAEALSPVVRGLMADAVRKAENDVLVMGLRRIADDQQVLWEVARAAIEDALIEWRDGRLSMLTRNNGFVVKEKDGTDSSVIRFGPEVGVRIALLALADHLSETPRGEG